MTAERDLFANFERMRREMDELFGDVFDRSGFAPRRGFSPAVDVYYAGKPARAVVEIDLAGICVEDVALEVRGRQIVIEGERRASDAQGRLYQQMEIPHGPFRRVVELGADVVADRAAATYEDGLLRIDVPLADTSEDARRIPIEQPSPGDPE